MFIPWKARIVRRYDFEDSVGYWLCVSSHAVRRAFESRLGEAGMTLRSWEVLAWLSCDGEVSQSQLAECLGIEPHTVAGVLARMERDGWIERTEHPDDRRRRRLNITPKAEAAWEQSIEICRQVRALATAGISSAELMALKRVCEAIRQNLALLGGMTSEASLSVDASGSDELDLHRPLQACTPLTELVAGVLDDCITGAGDLLAEEPTV